MKINGCKDVMLYVQTGMLDKAAEFFRDVLGAKLSTERDLFSDFGIRSRGAWLGLGTGKAIRVEIEESISETHPMGRQVKRVAPAWANLALEVENIDETITELRTKGIKVSNKVRLEEPRPEEVCFIHPTSCFGVTIELWEPKGEIPPDGEW